jgi:hypothetical protein
MTVPAREIPEHPTGPGREEASATAAQAGAPADAAASGTWSEIQAMFVDDPRRSVAEAADMVEEAISAFVDAARTRQASLASAWQDQGAGTEELRVALQDYRAFWGSVTGHPQPA